MSGQLDIVVEFPFLPSFPTPGAEERLYLAESVAFVIEVKSDLSAQWGQVELAAQKVRRLHRSWSSQITFKDGEECLSALVSWPPTEHAKGGSQMTVKDGTHEPLAPVGGSAMTSPIPFIALGFVGYDTVESLEQRLRSTPEEKRPDAALVLKTGAYVGFGNDARGVGAAGLFAFCTEAASLVTNVLTACPDFRGYFASP